MQFPRQSPRQRVRWPALPTRIYMFTKNCASDCGHDDSYWCLQPSRCQRALEPSRGAVSDHYKPRTSIPSGCNKLYAFWVDCTSNGEYERGLECEASRFINSCTQREDHAQSWPRVVVLTEILLSYIPNKVAVKVSISLPISVEYPYESHSGYKESAVAALRRATTHRLHAPNTCCCR